ncbi:S24 family peptidase [Pseudoblastomonas halimionae]|uniref:Transcriptional regulator n=1 Tax=Alteriqipengyuania halimionae TaxID=1926630 RepID=A0A6I4TZL3_9SPHN|nr:S24 family peptidase [Alteriqipengyuania halimionae]MXP09078.1 transcriptional regulator [Alteriqipengyuania halimionae]
MHDDDARANLARLAEQRKASLKSLSAMIGRNASYLQQYLNKGSPRRLDESDRRTLARFFGVDEGMLGAPEEFSRAVDSPYVEISRLDAEAAAGAGAEGGSQEIGHIGFAPHWLRAQGLDPAHCSAIAVRGDSMEPTLAEGDEILVDTRTAPLRSGVYVLRVDGQLLVKRLAPERPGTLISDNAIYPPLERDPAEVEVIGRVVWKSGRL